MPATKPESAEAVRRAFVASVISHSPMFARACTVRARKASALRRIGVVTVAVPLADSAVPSVDEELRMGCGKPRGRGQSPRAGLRGSRRPAVRPRVSRPTRHRGGPHAGYGLWSFHFPMLPGTLVSRSAEQRNTGANGIQHRRVTDFRRPAERCRRAKDRRWQRQGFRA